MSVAGADGVDAGVAVVVRADAFVRHGRRDVELHVGRDRRADEGDTEQQEP